TGADSPVIADSSIEAMPSTTSPSEAISSPASTSTRSPGFRSGAATCSHRPFGSYLPSDPGNRRFAIVSVRARRSVAAWALPRPSATASAKLANKTVTQSQAMIWAEKPRWPPPVMMSRMNRTVVSVATISTTNMTGLRNIRRGSSLRKASPTAGSRMAGSTMLDAVRVLVAIVTASVGCAGLQGQVLDDGPERERGKEGQCAGDQDDADQKPDEQTAVGGDRTG